RDAAALVVTDQLPRPERRIDDPRWSSADQLHPCDSHSHHRCVDNNASVGDEAFGEMVVVAISSSGANADPACRLWCFPRAIRAERYVVAWRGINPAVGRFRKNGSPSGRLYVVPVAWLARHRTISDWCQTRPRDRLRRIGCRRERCWLGAPILGVVVGGDRSLVHCANEIDPRRLVLLPIYHFQR